MPPHMSVTLNEKKNKTGASAGVHLKALRRLPRRPGCTPEARLIV